MVIFNSYVSLPEGTCFDNDEDEENLVIRQGAMSQQPCLCHGLFDGFATSATKAAPPEPSPSGYLFSLVSSRLITSEAVLRQIRSPPFHSRITFW